ncbi:MAG TPA: GTP cyclohydrolase I [Candidatus Limnocylindria bacterium]|jgi:GTP cyclohydrolase I|nr:GTP cyclohydrolase I [Candidatus Limnocylindria bacterium]
MTEVANHSATLQVRERDEEDHVLVQPRNITHEQWQRFERYTAEIFSAFGMRLDTPGTRETPRRFVRALFDATEGYEGDPKLLTAFPTECKGGAACQVNQIVEGPIPFFALCEHHALPFFGSAYVGYVAHEEIIGISKLTRLVRVWARRFTVQERMGDQIADTLDSLVHAHGVAVYLEAHHLCTQMRGVRELHPKTRTAVWRGEYAQKADMRNEFFHLIGRGSA